MPRIDPERLLKTLAPLLEPASGAIKSDKEVDKIYGLMSKFSKKLVSKCTYINILKASHPDVLDLFLQRGGWDMVLGWTADATSKKNYDLLKEITGLLLYAPATVERLKENELPKIVKSLSKSCENEEIREISKKIVEKWIDTAKQHTSPSSAPNKSLVVSQSQNIMVQSSSITSSSSTQVVVLPSSGVISGDTPTPAEFDISTFDITPAVINDMIDFNPEDFSKAVDQHLGGGGGVVGNLSSADNIIGNNSSNPLAVSGTSADVISSNPPISLPKTPKLLIKTVDGQKAVVQSLESTTIASTKDTSTTTSSTGGKADENPFCIMMKDGKPFLVRLKLATPQEVTQLQTETTTTEKTRRPRKDPNLSTKSKTENGVAADGLKTYSKKNPIEKVPSSKDTTDNGKSKSSSSKSSSKSSSSDPSKKRSSSSKSNNAAAAAANDERLREKIKQEKLNLKKRTKEAAKQKQMEKDQETLKKLNLGGKTPTAVNSSPSSMKIPKIQKKTSFADALGIPGGSDSIISRSPSLDKDKTQKKSSSTANKSEESVKKDQQQKEENNEGSTNRRHRPKVFSSKKSRADDLLKDMTENAKINNKNKSDTGNKASESVDKSSSFGNSIISKSAEKRPSIDGIEKPGDPKKQKLDDQNDKNKNIKDKKEKEKAAAAQKVIKESSLFMDALTVTYEKTTKRKRRLSSSAEKEKESTSTTSSPSLGKNGRSNSKDKSSPTTDEPSTPSSVKPVFNFYRETLDDSTGNGASSSPRDDNSKNDDEPMEVTEDNQELNRSGAFEEDELKLKSVLVIHRSKNKPKKSVRWREEDELKEVFTFELNEDERCNVAKPKDFSAMKEHEKQEERESLVKNLKRKILGGVLVDDMEDKMPWRRPMPLILDNEIQVIISTEKDVQEERERLNLGVFLPPGSTLPDTPAEPDLEDPDEEEQLRPEPRVIPMDDVIGVTKLFDKRNEPWPKTQVVNIPMHRPPMNHPFNSGFSGANNDFLQSTQHPAMQFPPPQNNMDFSNPWNVSGPPPISNMGEAPTFHGIGIPPPNMFPPAGINPFSFGMANGIPPPFPPPVMNFPPPVSAGMLQNHIRPPPMGLGTSTTPNNMMRNSGGVRDFGDRSGGDLQRRPFRDDSRRDSSYDSRGRSRGSSDYSSRSRDHDRDRDRRSPSPIRRRRDDRDRDRHSRDDRDRDHDHRSRGRSGSSASSGKKEIPCKFHKKGHCQHGSRCEFAHSDSSERSSGRSRDYDSRESSTSSTGRDGGGRNSSPEEDWEESTPTEENNKASIISTASSSSIEELFERRPSTETTNFTDAPTSPPNEIIEDPSLLFTTAPSEPAKIIPV